MSLVTLEQAKFLKEQGFKTPTEHYYQDKDVPYVKAGLKKMKDGKKLNHNTYDDFIYSAPSTDQYDRFIQLSGGESMIAGLSLTLSIKRPEDNVAKDMANVSEAYNIAKDANMTVEVFTWAMRYLKENPTVTLWEALYFGISEWVK